MIISVQRGDLFYADLDPGIGSEQSGIRPVLILQNNIGNCYSPTTIVTALTTSIKSKAVIPTHLFIDARDGLRFDSIILLEQIRTIDKSRLLQKIGHLDQAEMQEVDQCLLISLGISLPF